MRATGAESLLAIELPKGNIKEIDAAPIFYESEKSLLQTSGVACMTSVAIIVL